MRRSRMMLAVLLVLLLSSVFYAGCGCNDEPEPEPQPQPTGNVTYEAMEVEAGQEFQVVLEANPSTGYDWTVDGKPDPAVVEQMGEVATEAPTDPSLVGAPIKEIWKFKAVAQGKTDIVFENKRSWEESEPPAATHNVTVTVVAAHPKPPQPSEPKTYTDPNTPVVETVGNEFRINLSEQTGSTGYKWVLDPGYDHAVCVFQGTASISAQDAQTGEASVEVWKFKALGAGQTSLTFNYVQPWDAESAPDKTVTFNVTVNQP